MKTTNIFFSFDSLDILTFNDNYVYIRAHSYELDDDPNLKENDSVSNDEDCILLVRKILFHKMIDSWLLSKQKYFEMYNAFLGRGNIIIDQFELLNNTLPLTNFEYDEKEDKANYTHFPSKVYIANKYSVDMERG